MGEEGQEAVRVAFLRKLLEFEGWQTDSCEPLKALAAGLADQAAATVFLSKRMREVLFKGGIHTCIAGVRAREGMSQETMAELAKAEKLIEAEKDGAYKAATATASAMMGSAMGYFRK